MTMPPAPALASRVSRVHSPVTIAPDTGSGGTDLPPNLTSYTFGITYPDPQNHPGKYQADYNIPIGATASINATSPYGEENPITSWTWTNGSAFAT
jgi:hypothetical protein